ncbi:MAG TPA: DUF3455 domain-containing protein, partial [Flavisolibacter sp.]|nr:DUF3455 domain-containing protein [Flavisolibacter sp.]
TLSAITVGCRRQLDQDFQLPDYQKNQGGKHDLPEGMMPPAYYITKSEKLEIPGAIQVPANLPGGNTRVATFFAEGVQKYKAQQKAGDPATYEWVFVAPEADLYDKTNKKIGTHTAGPSWQLFGSADSIFAQQFSPPRTAPSTEPATIDWLLLMPKVGKTPTGIFANVAYIQRIATQGGKAPVTPPASLNETVEVKYTAVYRFTSKN